MKKVMKSLSVMLLMVALGMSFGSCGGDSDNLAPLLATAGTGTVSPADPEGTIVVNIGSGSSIYISNIKLSFTNEGNFSIMHAQYAAAGGEIVSVGPVAGLGFINTIPQEGWSSKVAAQVGNGYIIREFQNLYYGPSTISIRFYVADYNDAGGITIKYQLWNGPQQ